MDKTFSANLKTLLTAQNVQGKKAKMLEISLIDRIGSAVSMDEFFTEQGKRQVRVLVDAIGIVECHNENAKNVDRKDYTVAVFNAILEDGTTIDIATGSKSFLEDVDNLSDRLADLMDVNDEDCYLYLDIVARSSKNYAGRSFYKLVFVGLEPMYANNEG